LGIRESDSVKRRAGFLVFIRSLLNSSNGQLFQVNIKNGVFANQMHVLKNCLGNDDAVKRVAVMQRQPVLLKGVRKMDGKNLNPVFMHIINDRFVASTEVQFAQCRFYGNLPKAGNADEVRVGGRFDGLPGHLTQLTASRNEP
jgi:hypothetical protein